MPGKANVVSPPPPYMAPRMENRAEYWLIGNSWPSQLAAPGCKVPAEIDDLCDEPVGAASAWEETVQSNDAANAKPWLHVVLAEVSDIYRS